MKRAIIISAILTLGTAGSVLAGSAIPAAAAQAPSAHGVSLASSAHGGIYYHGGFHTPEGFYYHG